MANIKMLNMAGAEVGEITLNDAIFGIEPNEYAVHATVKNYLANQRQGTQSAKTRSEVRGGGRKPFRQTGKHNGSIPDWWWYRICAEAKRLQLCNSEEGKKTGTEVCAFRKGC